MKCGSSCDSTKILSLFIVLSEVVAVDWNLVNFPLLETSILFISYSLISEISGFGTMLYLVPINSENGIVFLRCMVS